MRASSGLEVDTHQQRDSCCHFPHIIVQLHNLLDASLTANETRNTCAQGFIMCKHTCTANNLLNTRHIAVFTRVQARHTYEHPTTPHAMHTLSTHVRPATVHARFERGAYCRKSRVVTLRRHGSPSLEATIQTYSRLPFRVHTYMN